MMPLFKNKNNSGKILFSILILLLTALLLIILVSAEKTIRLLKEINISSKNIINVYMQNVEKINERMDNLSAAELLLNNTNLILKTVYYGTADTEKIEEAKKFTAFSMIYKDKFYIVSAGHCVEMDNIKYKNFKFKQNFKFNWIYPELVTYKNDFANNNDYAIFYDKKITMGLLPAKANEDLTPQYVIGNLNNNLNVIKRYKDAKEGESGSPILNSKCHVIGVIIKKDGGYTPISVILDALENLDKAEIKK